MNDIQYVYLQDIRDKKSAGHGVYGKRSGARSKYVGLPHDRMTDAQMKRRNGPVKTYNISKCIRNWDDFKAMPLDLQRTYLTNVYSTYDPSNLMVAKSFGISDECLRQYALRNKLPHATHRGKRKSSPAWDAFIAGDYTTTGVAIPKEYRGFHEPATVAPVDKPEPAKPDDSGVGEDVLPAVLYKVSVSMEGTVDQLAEIVAMLTDKHERYNFDLLIKMSTERKEGEE